MASGETWDRTGRHGLPSSAPSFQGCSARFVRCPELAEVRLGRALNAGTVLASAVVTSAHHTKQREQVGSVQWQREQPRRSQLLSGRRRRCDAWLAIDKLHRANLSGGYAKWSIRERSHRKKNSSWEGMNHLEDLSTRDSCPKGPLIQDIHKSNLVPASSWVRDTPMSLNKPTCPTHKLPCIWLLSCSPRGPWRGAKRRGGASAPLSAPSSNIASSRSGWSDLLKSAMRVGVVNCARFFSGQR